ncbi:hypothetical protein GCM10023350_52600 [Nocardioides endophyticus]|uniref:Haloacid dehalogenase-like hydrolase n=1 Tax=Nocardioides endophyticus TaxID=1353775 RepID=A0ABP8ZMD1_9ACTN
MIEYRGGQLVRGSTLGRVLDDGPGKPIHIFERTGFAPAFAAGNANGDIEMLQSARFGVLVHHDDDEREYAYDHDAERALAAAADHGWLVVSMRDDFEQIFTTDAR